MSPDSPSQTSPLPPPADAEGVSKTSCPSAQADWAGAKVFGVVVGTPSEPRVAYLAAPEPIAKRHFELTNPLNPAEVLRIAAPCAGKHCLHFEDGICQLAARTVAHLQPIAQRLPPCAIRSTCRWWHEQGKAACFRCPQVVTNSSQTDERIVFVSTPNRSTSAGKTGASG